MDFEALRAVYSPRMDRHQSDRNRGLEEVAQRVKLLIADGQLLAERVSRASKERELLKNNATRAQRLVEESSNSLQTYQKWVKCEVFS
jgi:hypothetical protein